MHNRTIYVGALDTLFFRNGKPFSSGSEVVGEGVFPPMPSVLHGALRSAYFAQRDEIFRSPAHVADASEGLTIKAYLLCKNQRELLFPCPLDLVVAKDESDADAAMLEPNAYQAGVLTNHSPYLQLLRLEAETPMTGTAGLALNSAEIAAYLTGQNGAAYMPERVTNYTTAEPKTGIKRSDETGTVARSHLYEATFIRPENDGGEQIGIWSTVEAEWTGALTPQGLLRFGGEGKVAAYQCDVDQCLPTAPTGENTQIKIYLSTPAFFQGGWLPAGIDPTTGVGKWMGVKVTLKAAAVGKYLSVGGYDVAANRPKPMRRLVPAGSVYYLQTANAEDGRRLVQACHGYSVSDEESNIQQPGAKLKTAVYDKQYYPHRGFGVAYCGVW